MSGLQSGVLAAALLLIGCDRFRQAPTPPYLEQRRSEIADIQTRIDLTIAKSDSTVLLSAQDQVEDLQKRIGEANSAKNYDLASQLRKELVAAESALDKAAETAARHRCNR